MSNTVNTDLKKSKYVPFHAQDKNGYDDNIYGGTGVLSGQYVSVECTEDDEETQNNGVLNSSHSMYGGFQKPSFNDISQIQDSAKMDQALHDEDTEDVFAEHKKNKSISSREDAYRLKRFNQMLSPERQDPFGDKTPAPELRTYSDVMAEQELTRQKAALLRDLKKRSREEKPNQDLKDKESLGESEYVMEKTLYKENSSTKADADEWDVPECEQEGSMDNLMLTPERSPQQAKYSKRNRWDSMPSEDQSDAETPLRGQTPSRWGSETPTSSTTADTGTPKPKVSRWDNLGSASSTPTNASFLKTPGVTPLGMTGFSMSTPLTPTIIAGLPPDEILRLRIQTEMDKRLRPMTDEEIDAIIPTEGYEIVDPPPDYVLPLRPSLPLAAAAAAAATSFEGSTPFYTMPESSTGPLEHEFVGFTKDLEDVTLKAEDYQVFSKLFTDVNEDELTNEEIQERKIAALLLKIKNGTPPIRRAALKQITERAREFGPGPLFNQILPLMMQSTLEDQERHLLVKVIDRVLYRLDDAVRPYVHKVLVVVEPLLIDEDYYARVEGREIISNLAKAAGLATMIATMRPDIDHADEYVRNTTARAFAVVASALGIPALLLFLKAVCQSKKSWQARHTGIKIVQQISILMGCAVLPHLKQLVDVIASGLHDEEQKVRTIAALAVAALAEAAAPYGIEAFDCVLRPLWKGITEHRGKGLAAFLKAIGMIIPLMDKHHANYYTREVMVILIREFRTPDEEMKKIVLKVIKQCVMTDGVEGDYIRNEVLLPFFTSFWVVRNALDRRNARQVVETTVELAKKVGGAAVIQHIVPHLKDTSEPYRRMTLETLAEIAECLGLMGVNQRLEEMLVDGLMFAFQEQTADETVSMLNGFGTIMNTLGARCRPYLPQMAGTIRWRLNTPSSRNRQQAADFIARITVIMKQCDEEQMLGHLGLYLYEYLGEEYPEVLGSILGALKAIVNVVGMQNMSPPIKDLLPRLTPILKNRHEKVQENVIDLIGRIADRGGDLVSPKEWDRICFDLLELLRAHKKGIRRAAVNTVGYIARAIGPFDVLLTLLNNLKVQERQLRVCTTVAIAIVAETCQPYTVLPALMNEYKTPDLNVRNGVLKSLSFMFEYIGEMGKDYVHTVAPLLEDALTDRDLVHRQTAAWAVKHLALGVQCLGCEDVLHHLLNFVWPNIFETSPHLVQAFFDAMDGFRVSLGPCVLLQYLLQGLFHPARKVRECYWRIYNNVYIGHQDALVAFYPELPETPEHPYNNYRRDYLYLTL